MVEFRPAGLGVWFWVGFGVFVLFSTICLLFPSFNDDLGTMPTRRPYSWGCGLAGWKTHRLVLEEHGPCYSVFALLLAFVTLSQKRKGEESPSEKLRRLSSPRHWDVALGPVSGRFCAAA